MLEREPLDAAEPPRIVFETPDSCRDGDRAEALLRRTMAPALAPGRGWTLTMRVDRAAHGLRAEAEISDRSGAPVAHRAIAGNAADCGGLARAVGVWASLVLDSELRRANAVAMDAQPDGGSVGPTRATPVREAGNVAADAGVAGAASDASSAAAAGSAEVPVAWPAPAADEKPSPEHDWYLHHDEGRNLELGAGVFLMTGTGGGALAGPTAFAVVEAGHGIFLRPALAFGQSLTSLPPSDLASSTWAATRFDACIRVPGLYTRHHGMQLDLCGGSDLGFTTVQAAQSTTLPYLDLGPSIALRGELGSRLAAVLRMVAGVNLLRPTFQDLSGAADQPPLAVGRLELAFSWDLTSWGR